MELKSNNKKKAIVYKDESFLQNINLVTGNKINFQRTLSTEIEIKTLCINEKMSKEEKFLFILNQQNKMAKWSIFQNMHINIQNSDSSDIILQAVWKHYSQLSIDLLLILGQGIQKFLSKKKFQLSEKSKKYIELLFGKTLTSTQIINPQIAQQWSPAFQLYYKNHKQSIQDYKTFINGSFAMNATPERRQIAFILIKGLIYHPLLPFKETKTKVLFFNRDQNAKTRKFICQITEKILNKEPEQQQIWKIVWEYFEDKDQSVVKVAIKTLCQIKLQSNFLHLSNQLQNKQKAKIFLRQFQHYLHHFKQFYKQEKFIKQHSKLLNFVNKIIKSQDQFQIIQIFNSFDLIIEALSQQEVIKQIAFDNLNSSKPKIISVLIDVYQLLKDQQFKQKLKLIILKGLKLNSYLFFQRSDKLAYFFDLKNQEEGSIYLTLCNKMLQNNKWHCLQQILASFNNLRMFQLIYEKASLFLLKLILNAPYFLINSVIKAILYVMLSNRKSLQFLITIRQKLMNSKTWIHRRNYILLYYEIKRNSSFDFQKLVPILIYKNLSNQKYAGIKLQLIRNIQQNYKYIDPSTQQKKNMKETVSKLIDDKDNQVSKLAINVQQKLIKVNQDIKHIQDAYQRNKELIQKQINILQVEVQSKKIIKTQKDLRRPSKKKTEVRTTLNLSKDFKKQPISVVDSTKTINIQANKPAIFRHNSMKVKTILPPSGKNKL